MLNFLFIGIGPWLLVVMINDLQLLSDESFHIWKFADDTTVSEIVLPSCPSSLQQVVEEISSRSCENHLQLNPSKCKELPTCFKRSPPSYAPVFSDGVEFEQVSTAKILGVTFRQDLKRNDHVDNITAKAAKRLYLLRELKRAGVSCNDLVLFYCSAIRSVLEYACMLFHRSFRRYLSEDLELIQKRAMRIILPDYKYRDALKIAKIDTLYVRRESLSLKLFNEISHTNDHKLASLLPPRSKCRKLRNNRTFDIPICKTDRYKKSFIISHLY